MNHYRAAIDFGTNTARLLIVTVSGSVMEPVLIDRQIVRLGGGFSQQHGLSDEAEQRGLACLRRFSGLLREHGIHKVYAVATSAVRDAVNGAAFVEKAYRETGIRLQIIDGDTEAALTLQGVLSALDSSPEHLAVLDVGGGSTEFTIAVNGVTRFVKSMPVGVVRLTEGFASISGMAARIDSVMDVLESEMESAGVSVIKGCELAGTAGTATTLAAVKLEMTEYDARKVNNFTLGRESISEIYELLLPLTPEERLAIKGMEKGREDLIIAGIMITAAVMDRFGFSTLKVIDFGLLEGVALAAAEHGNEIVPIRKLRMRN